MPQETRNGVGRFGIRFGLSLLDREQCAQRLSKGMDPANYGPTNHLRPDYDWVDECLQELWDAFNQAAPIANRRARRAQMGKLPVRDIVGNEQNPIWESLCEHIATSIRLCRQLQQQQQAPLDEDVL